MPLLKIIPSYLYFQYQDDEDLQSFVDAYNGLAQQYLDSFNSLNMPVYTVQSGKLLDWFATGIYGYPRPVVQTTGGLLKGAYNTIPYNPLVFPYNVEKNADNGVGYTLTDNEYINFLTWNFYKGDGFQFNITWLKKRIQRFIQSIYGFAPIVDNTYKISVTFPAKYEVLIKIYNLSKSIDYALLIEEGINAGFLYIPFGFRFTVVSV